MDLELQEKLQLQEEKIDQLLESVKKIERHIRFAFWATIITLLLPILAGYFILPSLVGTYTDTLSSLVSS